MAPTTLIPLAVLGQLGATLLLAASVLAAVLGFVAFCWAMVLLWRENNPERTLMRGQGYSLDSDRDGLAEGSTKSRSLSWVGR
jgi:hypothetical protein